MTAQGEDILAWLDAAITGRERKATKAVDEYGADWYYDDGFVLARHEDDMVATGSQDFLDRPQGEHIAANDPASVLRRCAADRKLLELHGGRGHGCPAYDYDGDLDEFARFYNHEACPVVQHLAESYGWTAGQTPPTEGDQVT
ncbi:DUF6221 family protein [Streptomyces sp. NPDC059712]|uniref:DUF6221 family protein n=1 Tax=Streptomyces sp. NPDC059712 TaxID=3346919 RepID=UPI0036BA87A8